jgi:hypothetical protein
MMASSTHTATHLHGRNTLRQHRDAALHTPAHAATAAAPRAAAREGQRTSPWGGGSHCRPARGEQSIRGGRVGSGFPTTRSQPPRWIQYLRGPRSVGSGPTLGMPSGLSANSVSRPYWRQTRYHTHSLGDATPALWEADGRRARVQQTGETIPLRSLGKIFNRCFSTPPPYSVPGCVWVCVINRAPSATPPGYMSASPRSLSP